MSQPTGAEKKEFQAEEEAKRVRLTITSSKLQNMQRVCNNLLNKLKTNQIKPRGPIPMPRRRLRITTRRAPCGNGTETYDHFELRVHKRVIDFSATPSAIKAVTQIGLEPEVQVEVSVISE